MTYLEKVAERLDWRGLLLLLVGAVVGYCSGKLAEKLFPGHAHTANIVLKAAGLVLALVGGLILLDLIG